jgi:hypothetical protein
MICSPRFLHRVLCRYIPNPSTSVFSGSDLEKVESAELRFNFIAEISTFTEWYSIFALCVSTVTAQLFVQQDIHHMWEEKRRIHQVDCISTYTCLSSEGGEERSYALIRYYRRPRYRLAFFGRPVDLALYYSDPPFWLLLWCIDETCSKRIGQQFGQIVLSERGVSSVRTELLS